MKIYEKAGLVDERNHCIWFNWIFKTALIKMVDDIIIKMLQ